MFLGEVIKEYRNKYDLTMDDFASKSNLSKGYISMLEKNKHPQNQREIMPSLQTFKKVASAMNILTDDLIKMIDGSQKVVLESHNDFPSKGIRINVYGSVPAGVPVEAIEDIVDWEEIPTEWTKGGQEYIALKVKGDSMFPKYLDGDTVIIRLQPDCESGQNCVVYVNGYDATLKKVVKKTDCIILQPLNPVYDPKIYEYNNEEKPITILGIVVEIRRKV